MTSEEKAYRLRLPKSLYARLERLSKREVRSVNSQIIVMLSKSAAELERKQESETVAA